MTAIYTWDVFCTLDGFGSYGEDGDWGGYWGKEGPEFLERRLAVLGEEQRFVLGATTFREFLHFLGPASETLLDDPVNTRMKTLRRPSSRRRSRARSTGPTRPWSAATPSMSSGGSRRSHPSRCGRTAACR